MSEAGRAMTQIRMPLPLSAEDAYWHACTGTPYVPTLVPLCFDRECYASRAYFLSPPKSLTKAGYVHRAE